MDLEESPYPCIALVVSGGHTALYRADGPLEMRRLATTLDDAAGEAFDKVAYLLGLPSPGGPRVSSSRRGPPRRPRCTAQGALGFSFSGLKTAVLYLSEAVTPSPPPAPEAIPDAADVAASFEEAVVDVLVRQTLRAAEVEGVDQVLVAGGVACNRRLREVMQAEGAQRGIRATFPRPARCTDNAVMIAGLGWERFRAGDRADLGLDAAAR